MHNQVVPRSKYEYRYPERSHTVLVVPGILSTKKKLLCARLQSLHLSYNKLLRPLLCVWISRPQALSLRHKLQLSEDEIQSVFREADLDRRGVVRYEDFLDAFTGEEAECKCQALHDRVIILATLSKSAPATQKTWYTFRATKPQMAVRPYVRTHV